MSMTATSAPPSLSFHPTQLFLIWHDAEDIWTKERFVCKKTIWSYNDDDDDSNNNSIDLSSPYHMPGTVLSAVHILFN